MIARELVLKRLANSDHGCDRFTWAARSLESKGLLA